MKKIVIKIAILSSLSVITSMSYAEGFKRFSVSAGWLHVMPQGKANPFNINTAVKNGTVAKVGTISTTSFLNSIDPNATMTDMGGEVWNLKETLTEFLAQPEIQDQLTDGNGNILAEVAGKA